MSQTLKFAIIQMHVEAGNVEANTLKLQNMLHQAVSTDHKPDVILFPEMWNTGYALTEITTLADPNGTTTKLWLS